MNTEPQLPPPGAESQSLPVPASIVEPPAESNGAAKKATNKLAAERTYQVAQMLARQIPKHQVKRFLRDKHGLKWRMAEVYLARARDYLLERSQRDRREFVAEIMETYQAMLRDPETDSRAKLEALRGLRELIGADAPKKIAATTPDGEKSAPLANLSIDRLTIEQRRFLLGIAMSMDLSAVSETVALPAGATSAA